MSGLPTQGVVTPEAVILQFDTAGVGSRIAAQAIDFAIKILLLVVFYLIYLTLDSVGGVAYLGVTLAIFGTFIVTFGYPVAFETLWNGRTPGKAAFGLRVVTTDGAPIRFRHAAIRGALGVLEIPTNSGAIAFLSCLLTTRNQRLGDLVAGTLVLRERSAARPPQATSFIPPPGAEEFTLNLDVSSLTADDYIAIRSFLVRANSLQAKARLELSNQLGLQFAGRTKASVPVGMPAEIFLTCLAAAYQRRFAAR